MSEALTVITSKNHSLRSFILSLITSGSMIFEPLLYLFNGFHWDVEHVCIDDKDIGFNEWRLNLSYN